MIYKRESHTIDARTQSEHSRGAVSWSNRILILALAGILFLTLYPFRFDFGRHLPRLLFPFSLGGGGKNISRLDDLLNVLLFVPFGFGLAEKLREQGKSRLERLGVTLAAGTLFSYGIELLQIYISQRDSGWEDVVTNSLGALVGGALFELCGQDTLRLLSESEHQLCARTTWQRASLILIPYVGCWCAIAAHLQMESRLTNWSSNSLLTIGSSPSVRPAPAWKGRVVELEIWDHAVRAEFARVLTSGETVDSAASDPITAYQFSGSAPFRDQRRLLPDFSWTPTAPQQIGASDAFLDGRSWLTSSGAVPLLVGDLEKTGRFSLRVRCEPADVSGVDARIVSISSPSSGPNLELRQEGTGLAFWFRTPLTLRHPKMSWVVPTTFVANQVRDIMLTYDGGTLNLFVDGIKHDGRYELGPGVVLASYVRRIKTPELEGYRYIFYGIVFLPVGCLIGLVLRMTTTNWIGRLVLVLVALTLFAILFEAALIHVSGRAMAVGNIVLSILLAVGGSLWINADRMRWTRPEVSTC